MIHSLKNACFILILICCFSVNTRGNETKSFLNSPFAKETYFSKTGFSLNFPLNITLASNANASTPLFLNNNLYEVNNLNLMSNSSREFGALDFLFICAGGVIGGLLTKNQSETVQYVGMGAGVVVAFIIDFKILLKHKDKKK